ncbi:unnamed protein product [Fusarium graminearum]|nr:unnamed protein product [Fusarium graminearum]
MLFFWLELGKRFHGAFKLMRMDFSTSCNNIVVRRVISQTAYVLRHTARFGRKADVDAELDGLDSRTEGCPADRAHLACVNNYRVPDKGYYNCALMNQYARVLAIGYDRTKVHNIDRPLSRGKKRTDGTVALDMSWQSLRMFEDHRVEPATRAPQSKMTFNSPNNRLYLFQFSGETPEAPLGAALTKGKGAAEMHMDVMDHGLDRSIAKEKKEEKKNKGHLARKERIVMTDTWTVTRWVTAFTTHLKERRLGIRDQGILCDSLTEMVISGCDLKAKKRLEALKNYISFLEHRL